MTWDRGEWARWERRCANNSYRARFEWPSRPGHWDGSSVLSVPDSADPHGRTPSPNTSSAPAEFIKNKIHFLSFYFLFYISIIFHSSSEPTSFIKIIPTFLPYSLFSPASPLRILYDCNILTIITSLLAATNTCRYISTIIMTCTWILEGSMGSLWFWSNPDYVGYIA